MFTIEASVFCPVIGHKKPWASLKAGAAVFPPFLDATTPKHRKDREGLTHKAAERSQELALGCLRTPPT